MAVVVITVVVATNFLTSSNASVEAFKIASLLKSLPVNAIILGEHGTGKKTLAQYILPNANIIDAIKSDELLLALQSSDELIIINIDKSPNVKILSEQISLNSVRVIITGSSNFSNDLIDEICNIKIYLPPLCERKEDIKLLTEHFVKESKLLLGSTQDIDYDTFEADISQNASSLRRQVFFYTMLHNVSENEIMHIVEDYIYDKLGSNSDYRKFVHLFEVPLIRAGMKKFKSQLQLSQILGLNRNTLRKKIADHKEYNI